MTNAITPIHPLVNLMRGFAVDWLSGAHPEACDRIMDPGYTAIVGGVALEGRDVGYKPSTLAQLERFPGLLLTVHDLFLSEDEVALHFSEHGPSIRDGHSAAWTGIGIFRWNGERLTFNVTEEDYLSRRRQLATGEPDPVAVAAVAPWSAVPEPPDPAAEAAVRAWLDVGELSAGGRVSIDDAWTGQPTPPLLHQHGLDIDTVLCAGRRVAFHATQFGTYLGGLDVPDEPVGADFRMRLIGMVSVVDPTRIAGSIVRDRVGLRRDLVDRATPIG